MSLLLKTVDFIDEYKYIFAFHRTPIRSKRNIGKERALLNNKKN